jgi:hypothetical protein
VLDRAEMLATTQIATWQGPFVVLAGLFEYAVVDEVSRHFTVGSLVDLVEVDPSRSENQSGLATLAIVTVAGEATRVPKLLRVVLRSPAGIHSPIMERLLHCPDRAASDLISIVDTIQLPDADEGLHWFEVVIGPHLVTSFPLTVRHERDALPSHGPSAVRVGGLLLDGIA